MLIRTLNKLIIHREPYLSDGLSGALLERITLEDGRTLIAKHISTATDYTMRATHDSGRLAGLWDMSFFERLPQGVDHAMVAVEPEDQGWVVYMRDKSASLLGWGYPMTRQENRRVFTCVARLHRDLGDPLVPGLCTLEDRIAFLSPAAVQKEAMHPRPFAMHRHVRLGWQCFVDLVPSDVRTAVFAVHEAPAALAAKLRKCASTFIHGDLNPANVGFEGDGLVLIDWGSLSAMAPPAIEFTWFLALGTFAGITLGEALDEAIAAMGDRHDPLALELALVGSFAAFGWKMALEASVGGDGRRKTASRGVLEWWTQRVRQALDVWSPC